MTDHALRAYLWLGIMISMALLSACQLRPGRGDSPAQRDPAQRPPVAQEPRAQVPVTPKPPQKRILPPLKGEPQLDVLLQRSNRIYLTLLTAAQVDNQRLGPGRYLIELRPEGIVIAAMGLRRQNELVIDLVNQSSAPSFSLQQENSTVNYGGDVVVKVVEGRLAICERIGLEDFLPGVLVKEMGASWPLEALKAQAVAARSYISSQYLRRHDQPWHLAAAERVDLAYAGFIPNPHPHLATALRQTRGDLLMFGGLPLTAWFHSCSGGRTAGKNEAFANRMAADDVTDPAPAMPSVDDPWALKGATGLKRMTVYQWDFTIDGAGLSWRIRQNAAEEGKNLALGTISKIAILSHHPSGRANQLAVFHDGALDQGRWLIDAYQFRLWAGSHQIRSTWWTQLEQRNGNLFFAGRGFGHGVGMSQISAWAMAQDGILAGQILRHFYPGATLLKRW